MVVQTPTSEGRQVRIEEVGGAPRDAIELAGAQVNVIEVAAGSVLIITADGPIAVSLVHELIDGQGLNGVLPIQF